MRREILQRLGFLNQVGLGYLTLDRESGTLSGGEAQRIRLATQIGSKLTGVLYILDEPSIGLHQRDNERLLETLRELRDLGNTVIVVEHDEDTIRAADYLVDLGPHAGLRGGQIVAAGTVAEVLANPKSLTGQFLNGAQSIRVPKTRLQPQNGWVRVINARENNLRNVTVGFPVGLMTCVTGVSGSGKSTLVNDVLCRALFRHFYHSKEAPGAHDGIDGLDLIDKAIVIDQTPIGRTPRSNPLTYTGAFNSIRDLFAQLPSSRVRGYGPGRFSFNVKGGRCEHCEGDGVIKIEMNFLPPVYVTCEACGGRRFNRETLEITYKGLNIADVLEMTVDDGLNFFRNVPAAADKLEALAAVGLGYLHLGQQATTLSGGEAQRVKLAAELAKRATGRTMYILDEPTSGLHFADIEQLLQVLFKLRNAGNTLVIIEHQLDVIKCADYVIDLGPEGGEGGGQIVAKGTPEFVAAQPASHTGKFLRKVLAKNSSRRSVQRLDRVDFSKCILCIGPSVDVVVGPDADAGDFLGAERAHHFRGHAHDERAGRNPRALGHQRVRADDAALADDRAVENRRAHADEAFVLHRAGVQDRRDGPPSPACRRAPADRPRDGRCCRPGCSSPRRSR